MERTWPELVLLAGWGPQPPPPPEPPPDIVPPEPPPLSSEVDSAIKLLSYGKSPGMGNLPADLIKN